MSLLLPSTAVKKDHFFVFQNGQLVEAEVSLNIRNRPDIKKHIEFSNMLFAKLQALKQQGHIPVVEYDKRTGVLKLGYRDNNSQTEAIKPSIEQLTGDILENVPQSKAQKLFKFLQGIEQEIATQTKRAMNPVIESWRDFKNTKRSEQFYRDNKG